MHEYSVIPFDDEEINFLRFVKDSNLKGFAYPNMPGGTLYKVMLDKETATFVPLKFRLKVFGKSKSLPKPEI